MSVVNNSLLAQSQSDANRAPHMIQTTFSRNSNDGWSCPYRKLCQGQNLVNNPYVGNSCLIVVAVSVCCKNRGVYVHPSMWGV